jgi:hypothetical protein
MTIFDRLILLATGLVAIYALWRFYGRYQKQKKLHDLYYMMAFAVLLVSGLLLIFLGYGILASPYILTVASLIPLGISMGLMNQLYPGYKRYYSWFALVGILAIAIISIGGLAGKPIAVSLFHSVAGLIIVITPIIASQNGAAGRGFWWVSVGGALISLGGVALAFLSMGSQLLFFSQGFVMAILAPLLLLMALALTWGFMKDIHKK